jgi:hypothetical protein
LFGVLNPYDGSRLWDTGFIHKISEMYHHDREICVEWSTENIVDEDGFVTEECSLYKKAKEFAYNWRTNNKGDEESLRRQLNYRFFNTKQTISAVYSDGKLISPTIRIKDSLFHRQRAIAMQDLYLTKAQWAGIYQLVEIMRERIKRTETTSDEREAAKELREGLEDCKISGNLYAKGLSNLRKEDKLYLKIIGV